MGRILAIDYGTKRIGVAISDETKRIAFPKPYIPTEKRAKLLEFLKNQEVERILIGMPKNLAGEETNSTKKVKEFASWLRSKIFEPIEFIDERFSTKEAAKELKSMGMKRDDARELIDSLVAQKILERYLRK